MQNALIGIFMGSAVSLVSGFIMGWWAKHFALVKPAVNRAVDAMETRLGHKAPGWAHNVINAIVDEAVDAGNKIMTNGPLIRNMLRGLANGDVSKLAVIESQLASVDWTTPVMAQLPAEYKDAVHAAINLSVNQSVAAKVEKALPEELIPPTEVLHDMVEKSVIVQKVEKAPTLVTTNDIEKMIAESKARQETLKK